MSYPKTVSKMSLNHRGGTKSYHLTLVEPISGDGPSAVIRRWGKTGAFGEVKVELFPTKARATAKAESLIKEKQRKGYESVGDTETAVADLDELMKAVGRPTWAKLTAPEIKHIDSAADVSGVRERDEPSYDEDGKWMGKPEPRKVIITEEMIEADKRARMEELRARNPNYGRF